MAKEAAIITSTTNHEYLGRKSKKHGLDKKKKSRPVVFHSETTILFLL